MGMGGQGWFGGGFDEDRVGLRESGCGNEGSVVECGDDLQREIDGGHDVGHDGLEKPKGQSGYCARTRSMRAWSC
ncbi:hypothetical protein FH972_003984 [Carpinus fangiana]|uniref:Uncharacterized protein n=1 Tax=Carpinus fangiana TaxID=176857 RepID=A0A5N6QM75_9ROSI|nr:hypothetical protein FH972_003984 [Carpinus fangiana]